MKLNGDRIIRGHIPIIGTGIHTIRTRTGIGSGQFDRKRDFGLSGGYTRSEYPRVMHRALGWCNQWFINLMVKFFPHLFQGIAGRSKEGILIILQKDRAQRFNPSKFVIRYSAVLRSLDHVFSVVRFSKQIQLSKPKN
jgi:hypothetical protein